MQSLICRWIKHPSLSVVVPDTSSKTLRRSWTTGRNSPHGTNTQFYTQVCSFIHHVSASGSVWPRCTRTNLWWECWRRRNPKIQTIQRCVVGFVDIDCCSFCLFLKGWSWQLHILFLGLCEGVLWVRPAAQTEVQHRSEPRGFDSARHKTAALLTVRWRGLMWWLKTSTDGTEL